MTLEQQVTVAINCVCVCMHKSKIGYAISRLAPIFGIPNFDRSRSGEQINS